VKNVGLATNATNGDEVISYKSPESPYLNLIFATIIADCKIKLATFVTMTGMSFFIIPYAIHVAAAVIRIAIIQNEMSFTRFVFHAWMTCGRNEATVRNPAAKPMY
jgi:hypothetical protein